LLFWVGVLAVLFVFLSTAYREGARAEERVTQTVEHALRMRVVSRVVEVGPGSSLPGQLLSVATADVGAASGVIAGIAYGTGVVVALAAGTVVLLVTSVELGLTVLVGLPIVVFAGGRLGALLSRRAAGQQAEAADASGVAADLVTGLRVLQGIGGVSAGVERYRVASQSSLVATLSAARAEIALGATAVLVGGAAVAGVAFIGGSEAMDGEISLGQVIAAVGVTQFMVGPLTRLAWVGGLFARARASAARLEDVLATASPAVATGSLALPPDGLIGVVADDPEWVLAVLERDGAVVAPHEATLFSGTVRDNVSSVEALEAVGMGEFSDVSLTDGGASLSGGQRQRIALARALETRAPILALHDPTTALDAATEARIAASLRAFRQGARTILVCTSPLLLASCDSVAVVRDRSVVAIASHAEHLESDAAYREAVA